MFIPCLFPHFSFPFNGFPRAESLLGPKNLLRNMLNYRAQGTLRFEFSRPGVGPQNLDFYSLQTDSNISATCSSIALLTPIQDFPREGEVF